ncbi:GntR family transcriptional regulator, partial [Polaribacter sp. BAL334]|uniref:GntR family transcriptional regulator n=1 Tax=Polaribacter sp. BAL334 TaxID=1708178 RepID=UPI0018D23CDA
MLHIHHDSDIPKYQQIVNAINDSISKNIISVGYTLPSVNTICKNHTLSRDTVFKAYSILKEDGVIEAVPNKGYYVASKTKKVLLVLDTFKAYKEVLYHSFINNLPDTIITDVQFHHYNIDNFKAIVNNSVGKYYKYIIMGFDHKTIPSILSK